MASAYQKLDAAEGLSLKVKLRRAERKRKIKAAGLVAPPDPAAALPRHRQP